MEDLQEFIGMEEGHVVPLEGQELFVGYAHHRVDPAKSTKEKQ